MLALPACYTFFSDTSHFISNIVVIKWQLHLDLTSTAIPSFAMWTIDRTGRRAINWKLHFDTFLRDPDPWQGWEVGHQFGIPPGSMHPAHTQRWMAGWLPYREIKIVLHQDGGWQDSLVFFGSRHHPLIQESDDTESSVIEKFPWLVFTRWPHQRGAILIFTGGFLDVESSWGSAVCAVTACASCIQMLFEISPKGNPKDIDRQHQSYYNYMCTLSIVFIRMSLGEQLLWNSGLLQSAAGFAWRKNGTTPRLWINYIFSIHWYRHMYISPNPVWRLIPSFFLDCPVSKYC